MTLSRRQIVKKALYEILQSGRLLVSQLSWFQLLGSSSVAAVSLFTLYKLVIRRIARIRQEAIDNLVSVKAELMQHRQNTIIDNVKGVMLSDGRWLSYAECGRDDSSNVVVFFHSLGSCRLESVQNQQLLADQLNVRLIHIDRPGYGQSDVDQKRSFLSFAEDVHHLLRVLKVSKFACIGVDAGAAFALATTYYNEHLHLKSGVTEISLRCVGCACISAQLPYINLSSNDFSSYIRDHYFLTGRFARPLLQLFLYYDLVRPVFSDPEQYTLNIMRDEAKYYTNENQEDLNLYFENCVSWLREGMNMRGYNEPVRELTMLFHNWGFELSKISTPVTFYHGRKNRRVRINLVKQVVDRMPKTTKLIAADAGEFFWLHEDFFISAISELLPLF